MESPGDKRGEWPIPGFVPPQISQDDWQPEDPIAREARLDAIRRIERMTAFHEPLPNLRRYSNPDAGTDAAIAFLVVAGFFFWPLWILGILLSLGRVKS